MRPEQGTAASFPKPLPGSTSPLAHGPTVRSNCHPIDLHAAAQTNCAVPEAVEEYGNPVSLL